jgi:hypothetical protein
MAYFLLFVGLMFIIVGLYIMAVRGTGRLGRYLRGDSHMIGQPSQGIDWSKIPVPEPGFEQAREWQNADGVTVTAADDPLYKALGVVQVVVATAIVGTIGILVGEAI